MSWSTAAWIGYIKTCGMPIVIKEIRIRTVVEKRIITETEVSDEIVRKIESRVLDRLSEENLTGQPAGRRQTKRRNER